MIEIKIDGSKVNKVIADFSNPQIFHDPMEASLALLHDFMARYPAQRPTRYRRTGNLGRRWTSRISNTGNGLYGEVGNSTSYGPFVQDAGRQARWNRHWQTDLDAVRQNEGTIRGYFDQALQKVADR